MNSRPDDAPSRLCGLVLGTFVDNLLISKAWPLVSAVDADLSWLIDHESCPGRQKKCSRPHVKGLRYDSPPAWLQRTLRRNLGKFVWAAYRSFRPDCRLVISYYIWPHGIMAALVKMLHFGRMQTVHFLIAGPYELQASSVSPSGIRRWHRFAGVIESLLLRLLRTFDHVVVMGSRSRSYLTEHGVLRTSCIPGSIDTQTFCPDEQTTRIFDLIYVGRIDPNKNQATLLAVMHRLLPRFPDLRVACVGWDPGGAKARFSPSQDDVAALAARLGIAEHLELIPFTSEVAPLLRQARIYIQTSFNEGLSNSLREAMACGLPVVASDVGDTIDVVVQGQTGLLVHDPTDIESYVEAISSLLADEAARLRMGQEARKLIVATHSREAETSAHRRLFRDLHSQS